MQKTILMIIATALVTGTTGCMSMGTGPLVNLDGLTAADFFDSADEEPDKNSDVVMYFKSLILLPVNLGGFFFKGRDWKMLDGREPETPQPKPTPQP